MKYIQCTDVVNYEILPKTQDTECRAPRHSVSDTIHELGAQSAK